VKCFSILLHLTSFSICAVPINSTEDYKVYKGESGVCGGSVAIIAITEICEVSLNTYVVFQGQITQLMKLRLKKIFCIL
jgi:hypothetical protein